jgi:hypothetical protein
MERDNEPLTIEELCFVLKQCYSNNTELSIVLNILRRSPEAFNKAIFPYKEHCRSLHDLYKSFGREYNGNIRDVHRQSKSFIKTLLVKELKHFV